MANCNIHGLQEISEQRRLNIILAKKIDYMNAKLFNMERKMLEKEILLNEALQERKSFKLELEKLKSEMECQKKEVELHGKDFNNFTQSNEQENEKARNEAKSECESRSNQSTDQRNVIAELLQLKVYLKELEVENADMKDDIRALIIKERMANDELQGARKEAIEVWQSLYTHHRSKIRIKRMGEMDRRPFQAMCSKKCSPGDREEESAKLCSLWEDKVKNPQWHPFKRVENHGKLMEIVDEDDEKLKELRTECGTGVYNAVVDALMELNEYNPSGRYPVPELWHLTRGRKASMKEVIEYIMQQLARLKSKSKLSSW